MVIEYKIGRFIQESHQIEIADTKNVFLSGKNPYNGLTTFFGIWINKNMLVIVTIINWCTINYKCYLNTDLHTTCDIREYLENNRDVKIIAKDEFKEQVQHIRTIIDI